VKETGGRLAAVEREGDGRQRALARRLATGGDQRKRRRQPAAPARLPGRVGAGAIADREHAGLLQPAAVDARLVSGERRREGPFVDRRGDPRKFLSQRVQPFEQGRDIGAVEDVDADRDLVAPAGADGQRGARAVVALGDRQRDRRGPRRRAWQPDDAEARGGQVNAQRGNCERARIQAERRRTRAGAEARDVGHDRRDVGADVGRLGEQRRVGGAPRLEAVAGVDSAGQHDVVVPGPRPKIERDPVIDQRRVAGADGRDEIERAGLPRNGGRRERDRAVASRPSRRAQAGKRHVDDLAAVAAQDHARADVDLRVAQPIEDPVPRRGRRDARRGREREPAGRGPQPPQERPAFHARARVHPSREGGAPVPDSFW
jgi:hypothetical protein